MFSGLGRRRPGCRSLSDEVERTTGCGQVGGSCGLGFVVELVGGASAHERHGNHEVAGLKKIKPGVQRLVPGFEFAGAFSIPGAIVSGDLAGLRVQAAQLPVGSDLFKDEGNCGGAFRRSQVEGRDRISSWGQVVQDEDGAVGGLASGAEDSAEELSPFQGSGAFGLQEKWRARVGLSGGEDRLVVFDGGFDPREVCCQAGNGTLTERGAVAARGEIEEAPGGGQNRGAGAGIHVVSGGTGLSQAGCGEDKDEPQGRGTEAKGSAHGDVLSRTPFYDATEGGGVARAECLIPS